MLALAGSLLSISAVLVLVAITVVVSTLIVEIIDDSSDSNGLLVLALSQ